MRLSVNKGELALALVFVAVGGLWIAKAVRMSLWDGFAPDSGFLPLIYGALLAGLAVAVVVQLALSGTPAAEDDVRKPLVVLAALIAAVSALPFAGFLVSVFLLLAFLYAVIERLPLLPSVLVSAATTGALYLVFKTWLGVPLP
ncbi:MAG: tripartite tricarboxylate transporter TctB family protein [Burkholderiales bacterium]